MKTIGIKNFRCFKDLKVNFAPGVNLIIGDNASGKTSLLWAAKYAANCLFSGFSDQYTLWTTPGKSDFSRFFSGEKQLSSKPIELSFTFFDDELAGFDAYNPEHKPQQLVKKSKKNSRPLLSTLKELREYGRHLAETHIIEESGKFVQPQELPLVASYSTHSIHSRQKAVAKYFSQYAQMPSFGYYLCHSTDGLLDHWVRRLLVLHEADANSLERRIVTGTLMRMFGSRGCGIFSGIDIRINYKDLVCRFTDGREIPVSILSDGYRRLFSIVIDLAFRCALLNSLHYGEEAAQRTHGIVIIDEIDLHLHPSLQAVVIKELQHTFPSLQFIISTHAPVVMSGVESCDRNTVLYMSYSPATNSYTIDPVDTYGMDMTTLSHTILQTPVRDTDVDERLSRLNALVDREDYDAARQLLAEMKSQFGSRIPELAGIDMHISLFDEENND